MQFLNRCHLSVTSQGRVCHVLNLVMALGAVFVMSFEPSVLQTGGAVWVRKDVLSIALCFVLCILAFASSCFPEHLHVSRKRNISFLLAFLSLFGEVLANAGDVSLLYGSFSRLFRTAVFLPAMTWLIFNLLNLLSFVAAHFNEMLKSSPFAKFLDSRNVKFIYVFVVLLVLWLPYMIVFYPGSLPTDTSRQLGQWFGSGNVALDNHFPFFTTLVYGTIFKIGDSFSSDGILPVFLLTFGQYLLGALVFSIAFQRLSEIWSTTRVCIGVIFIGLFPIIPVYVVSISKDYLHALFFFLYISDLFVLLKRGEEGKAGIDCARLLVDSLLVSLTRNNGFYVCLITYVFLFVFFRKSLICFSGIIFFVLYVGWNTFLLPVFGVAPSETREMLSIPAQIVARIYSVDIDIPDDIDDTVMKCWSGTREELSTCYNFQISDSAKGKLVFDTPGSLFDYLITVLRLSVAHPAAALSAALSTTSAYWYPFCTGTYWMEDAPYYSWDEWSLIYTGWFKGSSWSDEWNSKHNVDSAALNQLHLNSCLSFLFKPGTYSWWLIYLLGWSFGLEGRRVLRTLSIPFFTLILTLLAGPCASLRYTLPFIFSSPLFIYMSLEFSHHD